MENRNTLDILLTFIDLSVGIDSFSDYHGSPTVTTTWTDDNLGLRKIFQVGSRFVKTTITTVTGYVVGDR